MELVVAGKLRFIRIIVRAADILLIALDAHPFKLEV
jgi:hypothetical protein